MKIIKQHEQHTLQLRDVAHGDTFILCDALCIKTQIDGKYVRLGDGYEMQGVGNELVVLADVEPLKYQEVIRA